MYYKLMEISFSEFIHVINTDQPHFTLIHKVNKNTCTMKNIFPMPNIFIFIKDRKKKIREEIVQEKKLIKINNI